jgi:NTE family protein
MAAAAAAPVVRCVVPRKSNRRPSRPVVHLALQGGGAHGAFTWGVLDRLLDEPDIEIGRISGASAGALNGAALATGLARGGPAEAKASLSLLWNKVAEAGSLLSLLMLPLRKPGMGVWDDALPLFSPYQTNLLAMEPLRHVLDQVVDTALLNSAQAPALFVNAVNVRTGCSRVFGPGQLSTDVMLASGCAPLTFQAVEIEGEPYWDGTYACNPHLWPLYEGTPDCDIFMVELTPLRRPENPTTAKNILNRINEIASINGLVHEMRALDQVNRAVPGADIRMHVLGMQDGAPAQQEEASIKRTVSRELFELLRTSGHAACEAWLGKHRAQLGIEASVDIASRYLAPYSQHPAAR